MINFIIESIEVNKNSDRIDFTFYHGNSESTTVTLNEHAESHVRLADSIYETISDSLGWVSVNGYFEDHLNRVVYFERTRSGDEVLSQVIAVMGEAIQIVNSNMKQFCEHYKIIYTPTTDIIDLANGRRRKFEKTEI